MSGKVTRQDRVIAVAIPRWLSWRAAGLIFLISVLVLFLALLWASRNDTMLRDRLHDQIKDLSRLSTVEYKLSTVVQVINSRGVWGDEILVYGACGRVVAGIDLSKLSKEDVKVDGSHVRIALPPSEIFTVDLIPEKDMREVPEYKLETEGRTVEMHSECAEIIAWDVPGPLGPTPQLVADAQEEALKVFTEDQKIKTKIEAEALENAQDLLKKWFDRLDFETVEIVPLDVEQEKER